MHRHAVDHRETRHSVAIDGLSLPDNRNRPMLRLEQEVVAVSQRDKGIIRPAKLAGAFDNRRENRLDVGRRRGDHVEDLAAAGLVAQRLREIARLSLNFVEQAHVLDSDDRLVGEGLRPTRSVCRRTVRRSCGRETAPRSAPCRAAAGRQATSGIRPLSAYREMRSRGRPARRRSEPLYAQAAPARQDCPARDKARTEFTTFNQSIGKL